MVVQISGDGGITGAYLASADAPEPAVTDWLRFFGEQDGSLELYFGIERGSMCSDADGNIYVVTYYFTSVGVQLFKVNPNGEILWVRDISTAVENGAYTVSIDALGRVWLAGRRYFASTPYAVFFAIFRPDGTVVTQRSFSHATNSSRILQLVHMPDGTTRAIGTTSIADNQVLVLTLDMAGHLVASYMLTDSAVGNTGVDYEEYPGSGAGRIGPHAMAALYNSVAEGVYGLTETHHYPICQFAVGDFVQGSSCVGEDGAVYIAGVNTGFTMNILHKYTSTGVWEWSRQIVGLYGVTEISPAAGGGVIAYTADNSRVLGDNTSSYHTVTYGVSPEGTMAWCYDYTVTGSFAAWLSTTEHFFFDAIRQDVPGVLNVAGSYGGQGTFVGRLKVDGTTTSGTFMGGDNTFTWAPSALITLTPATQPTQVTSASMVSEPVSYSFTEADETATITAVTGYATELTVLA